MSYITNWVGKRKLEYMVRDFENGVMVATIHPQVSGRDHRSMGLEKWIDQLLDENVKFERVDVVVERFLNGLEYGAYRPGIGEDCGFGRS